MWCQLSTWRAVYWLSANGWITVSIPCLCLCMLYIAGILQCPPSPGEAGTAQRLPLPETEPGSCWHQMGELQIGIERGRSSLVHPISFGYYSTDRLLTTLYQFLRMGQVTVSACFADLMTHKWLKYMYSLCIYCRLPSIQYTTGV